MTKETQLYDKRDLIAAVGTSLSNVSASGSMLSGKAAETVMTGNRITLAEIIRAHSVVFIPTWEPPV